MQTGMCFIFIGPKYSFFSILEQPRNIFFVGKIKHCDFTRNQQSFFPRKKIREHPPQKRESRDSGAHR